MVMASKVSNFPEELSKNDELREYELSGSDCISWFTLENEEILLPTSMF